MRETLTASGNLCSVECVVTLSCKMGISASYFRRRGDGASKDDIQTKSVMKDEVGVEVENAQGTFSWVFGLLFFP